MGRPMMYFTDEERRLAHNRATQKNKDKVRGGLPITGDRAPHCKAGHLWTEESSYIDARGIRHCRTCANSRHTEKRVKTKLEVLSHYGPDGRLQCSWPDCTVIDVDLLSIDHINDDGHVHRKENRNNAGHIFYLWLKNNMFPTGYQTLCYNHQWKKELMRRRG